MAGRNATIKEKFRTVYHRRKKRMVRVKVEKEMDLDGERTSISISYEQI